MHRENSLGGDRMRIVFSFCAVGDPLAQKLRVSMGPVEGTVNQVKSELVNHK